MTTKKAFLLLSVSVFLLYLPFLGNAFVSDDIQGIVGQATSWNWIIALGWPSYIHFSTLGQFVTYHVFGLQPWAFRIVNILFHLGSVLLVYLIGKRLVKPSVAFVAALLFAIHPLATESVTWISGGVYSQYTFWFLLAFWLYIQGKSRYVWSVLIFVVSIGTSEKALSLALVFPLYEFLFGNFKQRWRKLIPYFLLSGSLIFFYGTKIGERTAALNQGSTFLYTGLTNPLLQLPVAISSYLQLFVAPVGLTLYHSELTFTWWNFAFRSLVTIGVFGVGVYTLIKRKSWGFWIWWFLIGLLPTLTPLKLGWIVAERYVYCSLIGLCFIAAIFFDLFLHKKKWFVLTLCISVLVCLFFCTQTVFRNSQWRTEDTLWIAAVKTSPSHPPTWNNMGDVYARRGDLKTAVTMFQKAIALNPDYADAYHNVGHTYLRMGNLDEAKTAYVHAISINPNLWQSYRDLAAILYEEGDHVQAQDILSKALLIMPQDETLLKLQQLMQ